MHFVHHPAMLHHSIPNFRFITAIQHGTLYGGRFAALVHQMALQRVERLVNAFAGATLVQIGADAVVARDWWRFTAAIVFHVTFQRSQNFEGLVAFYASVHALAV